MKIWPIGRISARQREIRRTRAGRREGWRRRVMGGFELWSLLLTIAAALAVIVILSIGGEQMNLRLGQTVQRAVTARCEFQIADRQQTEVLRLRARDNAPNVYELDTTLLETVRGRLMSLLTLARAHPKAPDALRAEAEKNGLEVDDAGLVELLRLAEEPDGAVAERQIEQAVLALAETELVELSPEASRRTPPDAVLIDTRSSSEVARTVRVAQLRFTTTPEHIEEIASEAAAAAPAPLRETVKRSVMAALRAENAAGYRPLYRFSMDRTTSGQNQAAQRVTLQMLTYRLGAPLADTGVIDERELALLRAEHAALTALRAQDPFWWRAKAVELLATSLLAVTVIFGLSAYLSKYQSKVYRNPFHQSVATLVLLALLLASRLTYVAGVDPPHVVVGYQAFAAAMLAIVYTRGSVFALCAAMAILISVATQQDVTFMVLLIAVAGVFVVSLGDVRSRGKIVMVGLMAASAAAVIAFASAMHQGQVWSFALRDSLYAAGATLAAAFVVEGLLPAIERIFGFSTSMTLLEWGDASKPLLRLMAADAPGTYNHSLLVGALAEAAAEAVGANGLLCRTGALYHDIGKINKPEYFIENQRPGESRHERLSPAMSLLIIVGHVKDGIEMAKEYKLPVSLRPFIAEHHGTTLVEYFYHAANKLRKPGDKEVADSQFRYPGPKPQSRETAIVMLCDGVEGAVRAMPEPTPGRIESVVGEIISKRLNDGQFDHCDLTFRELGMIERSLIKSLNALYHARIEYPEAEERTASQEPGPAAEPVTARGAQTQPGESRHAS